jgi:hypothetical protein
MALFDDTTSLRRHRPVVARCCTEESIDIRKSASCPLVWTTGIVSSHTMRSDLSGFHRSSSPRDRSGSPMETMQDGLATEKQHVLPAHVECRGLLNQDWSRLHFDGSGQDKLEVTGATETAFRLPGRAKPVSSEYAGNSSFRRLALLRILPAAHHQAPATILCQVSVECPNRAACMSSPMALKSEGPLPHGIRHSTSIEMPQAFAHVVENVGNVVGDIASCRFLDRRHRQRIELL